MKYYVCGVIKDGHSFYLSSPNSKDIDVKNIRAYLGIQLAKTFSSFQDAQSLLKLFVQDKKVKTVFIHEINVMRTENL